MSLSGPAIEGTPLTLTCLSTGGYPRQDVSWYRGSLSTGNRIGGPISFVNNGLYDVTSTINLTPTRQDDEVAYFCQSSYSNEPRLIETSQHNLLLACIDLHLFLIHCRVTISPISSVMFLVTKLNCVCSG